MAETTHLGVFGSAFNPPHLAHTVFLGEARWQLGLDRVLIVPTGVPYHKGSNGGPGPVARLDLARAAFGDVEGVEVSEIEVKRPGPSYTYETLGEIADREENTEIHLLMGADAAKEFSGWQQPERILELARIGIASRQGVNQEQVEEVFEGLGASERIDFFDMPQVDISSSLVRHRIEEGKPFSHLVPTAVAEMIENEDMYGIE